MSDTLSPSSGRYAAPAERTLPNPTAVDTVKAWMTLAAPTVAVNLVLYAVAVGAGAAMEADIGTSTVAVGPISIVVVSAAALLSSTVVWAAAAHRSPAFADLWVPLGWGVGLVSLAAIIGVSGVTTGVALTAMHLVTTVVAAHLLPRALPRNPR